MILNQEWWVVRTMIFKKLLIVGVNIKNIQTNIGHNANALKWAWIIMKITMNEIIMIKLEQSKFFNWFWTICFLLRSSIIVFYYSCIIMPFFNKINISLKYRFIEFIFDKLLIYVLLILSLYVLIYCSVKSMTLLFSIFSYMLLWYLFFQVLI